MLTGEMWKHSRWKLSSRVVNASRRLQGLLLAFVIVVVPGSAAGISATGISVPFFDPGGKLTHKLIAQRGTKSGVLQNLQGVELHYFSSARPGVIVQKLEAAEATWDEKKETLVGRGPIVVATEENRLTGEGFDFALATSLIHIHRDFKMTNNEVVITSERATIELMIERTGEDLKVRDVRRCEAIENLRIVIQPAAKKKYGFKEAFSDRAIYDGIKKTVSLPHPTRTVQADGGEGRFETLTFNLAAGRSGETTF